MKRLNKMVSVLTALAVFASAPGAGTYSAFAQNVGTGVNAGARAVQPAGFNAGMGVQVGGSGAQVHMQGASVKGTVVGAHSGPSVSQKVSVQAEAFSPAAGAPSFTAPVGVNAAPVNVTAVSPALAGPSKTGPPSLINQVQSSKGAVAAMSAPKVSAEQASYQGKVQFDLAGKKAADGSAAVAMEAPKASEQTPEITAETKAKIAKAFAKVEAEGFKGVTWHNTMPLGVKYVRVNIKNALGYDGYQFDALVPAGVVSPSAPTQDPNKATTFVIAKSGGQTGRSTYSNSISMDGEAISVKSEAEAPKSVEAPAPSQKAKPQLGSKLSTFVDAVIVTAVGTYTHSVAAAYAALVVVSSIRYAPDFIKALSDDSKKMQSGFLRAAVVGGMALVAAPVAFIYESYENLIKPFFQNVWEAIKAIGRAVKNAAVWVWNNVIVPAARALRDFAKAAWQAFKDFAKAAWQFVKDAARAVWSAIKDFATFVKNLVVDFAKAVKQLAIDFYNNVVVPAARFVKQLAIDFYNGIKQLAKDFVQFVKDAIKAADRILQDIGRAIRAAATWVYDNVMTPVGHAIRGLGAGAIAGIAAAVVVAGPFLAAAAISFIVKPIHGILSKMAKWPAAFQFAAAVVAIPLVGTAIAVSYKALAALAALTVTGAVLTGFGGAAIEGVKEGFTNGFVAGIKKGFGDAVKLATGSLETAKTNYNTWRTNLK